MFALRIVLTTLAVPSVAYFLPGVHIINILQAGCIGAVMGFAQSFLRLFQRFLLQAFNPVLLFLLYMLLDVITFFVGLQIFPFGLSFPMVLWGILLGILVSLLREGMCQIFN